MRHRIKIRNFRGSLRYLENFWRYLKLFSRISRKIFRPNLGILVSEPIFTPRKKSLSSYPAKKCRAGGRIVFLIFIYFLLVPLLLQ